MLDIRWQYLLVISCMGARLRLVRNDNSRGLGMMPTHMSDTSFHSRNFKRTLITLHLSLQHCQDKQGSIYRTLFVT